MRAEWTALLGEAQMLSGERACVYDGTYHAGGRHIARSIKFIDGAKLWLDRVPIILNSDDSGEIEMLKWRTSERRFTMERDPKRENTSQIPQT